MKEGAARDPRNDYGEDEELHVLITGDRQEDVRPPGPSFSHRDPSGPPIEDPHWGLVTHTRHPGSPTLRIFGGFLWRKGEGLHVLITGDRKRTCASFTPL